VAGGKIDGPGSVENHEPIGDEFHHTLPCSFEGYGARMPPRGTACDPARQVGEARKFFG
jgi:hypothetical protein